jgi:hypothetical protein
MGRPKQFETAAEKQAAYRERKRLALDGHLSEEAAERATWRFHAQEEAKAQFNLTLTYIRNISRNNNAGPDVPQALEACRNLFCREYVKIKCRQDGHPWGWYWDLFKE